MGKFKKYFNFIIYFVYLLIFIFSVSLFWIGFHNVDLSHNILAVSYYENSSIIDRYVDKTSRGDYLDYYEGYRIGLNQMIIAFFINMLSVWVLSSWKKK